MAELTYIEKETIEKFLGMGGGYVLDFSNRTFEEFVGSALGLNIYDEKYHYASNSKANILRGFIKVESNYVLGKLLNSFCEYYLAKIQTGSTFFQTDEKLYESCLKIAEKLCQDSIIDNIEAIKPNSDDKDFAVLSKSIKESIEKNEPETALDRLHTFLVKYVRQLCDNHNLTHNRDEPINSIFGKYVKFITKNKLIESEMAENILLYSITILSSFNHVRNNKSFAHDNPILNYNESILIFNNISNSIKFIETIENQIKKSKKTQEVKQTDWSELPF